MAWKNSLQTNVDCSELICPSTVVYLKHDTVSYLLSSRSVDVEQLTSNGN